MIGDSRVNFGNGKYHIYSHVHSDSGHEGDALFTVDDDDGLVTQIWEWGCSHMMSGLQGWNNLTKIMIHICDSDASPGMGIFAEKTSQNTLYVHASNQHGLTAGELGGIVENDQGWLLVFNSITPESTNTANPAAAIQEIGVIDIGLNKKRKSVTFLKSSGKKRSSGCIAKYNEKFLLGYKEGSDFYLGTIDAKVTVKDQFEKVTGATIWGDRDDSFRLMRNGNIFWVGAPNNKGNTLIISEFAIKEISEDSINDGGDESENNNGNKDGSVLYEITLIVGLILLML
ncbi:hypothetical protein EIN_123710 [Entamoeba invadens IP1]|uniref:Uncharacterized protein n=1 Tax=Entamoeba invadens IP1 TaxID=370355 RepID=A0A0A1UB66_ENTIV|nr:hypothetical protein EIN_123710 [Entamoeba invadens IP1]ELP92350.1 hypothetical protein EIN_123710 [Entamoeba invadens IP1]|eukprot:XP_004259121.1 hypothetical protein EIN_123710 [Entamoeba invadens IP1]